MGRPDEPAIDEMAIDYVQFVNGQAAALESATSIAANVGYQKLNRMIAAFGIDETNRALDRARSIYKMLVPHG